MTYVDLNPVRAGISETLDESEFTSIQARIRRSGAVQKGLKKRPIPRLMPFGAGKEYDEEPASLPFDLRNYIELVDWTGRIARADKKGFIPADAPSILSDLRLSGAQWRMLALEIQKESITMFSGLDKLAARERNLARKAA